MSRRALAAFAILAIALIVLLFIASEQPPPRKRLRVAGKPQVSADKIIRDDIRHQKRGS